MIRRSHSSTRQVHGDWIVLPAANVPETRFRASRFRTNCQRFRLVNSNPLSPLTSHCVFGASQDATGAPDDGDVPPRIPVEIDDKLRLNKIARAATAAVDAGECEDGDLFLFSLNGIDGKGYSSDEHVESDSHAGGGSSSENSSDSSDDDGSEDDRAHEASHRRTNSKSLASNKPMAKVRHFESPRVARARLH